uniref:Glycosyltransferase n=1 Tax=Roseihalotalea indica TaxID=2867963 RepID=A0AA49PZ53_9BACT|nr:glycosyltransferase [Tunicatimonas sp. TK19036]
MATPHRHSDMPVAYLNLTRSGSRYPYNLIILFHKAGYHIYLQHHFSFIANLGQYSQWLLMLSELKICLIKPKKYELLVTDNDRTKTNFPTTILVNYNYFTNQDKKDCTLSVPFMMHPIIYKETSIYKKIEGLRSQERSMRVLFAGNSKEESYAEGKHYITDLFHKNFRPALLAYLRQHLAKNEQTEYWTNDLKNNQKFFFLSRIPSNSWLDTLSRADFFLAPCGVFMPFSHNIIEAMAVGTIPITEYGEMFTPPLINGETCLSYQTMEEVVEVVRQALLLPESEIHRMKANVIEYYNLYLEPEMIKMRLDKLPCKKVVLPFNVEKGSVDMFAQEQHAKSQ